MKNVLLFALLCIVTVSGFSQDKTLLWRIEGKDLKNPSYLYGTLHLKDGRAQQFGDSVMPAFNRCSTVLVENIDADSMDKTDMFKFILMKDKTVKDMVSKEDYDFLRTKTYEVMGKAGMMFNAIKPIYTIVMADFVTASQEMEFNVDGFFKNEARVKNKTLLGIETMAEAQKAMDEIPLEKQCKMMVDYFRNYSSTSKSIDTMITLYQNQDLQGINNYYINHKEAFAAFDKSLVIARNKKFIEKLIPLMKKQSVFCAVGSLHLPAESGLINQLQKKGYKVTPVFSKYNPKKMHVEDNRNWGYYEENDLLFAMRLPVDPSYELDTSDVTPTATYYEDDSLTNMGFVLVAAKIADSATIADENLSYQTTLDAFSKTEGWKLVSVKDVMYKGIICKEAEYNIGKGSNVRYKICKRNMYLYCFGVSGTRGLIYSDKADYFFDSIEFLQPSVYVTFKVNDEVSNQPLKEFKIRVASSVSDTNFDQDSTGFSSLVFPNDKEDKYIISISAKNYVTKKVEINTANVIKTGKNEIYLEGDAGMMKKKPNTDYSVFETPIARACMINDDTFSWDNIYIQTQKLNIAKKFKPAVPAK